MTHNTVSPRAHWSAQCPMRAYDRLPQDLRLWVSQAALPWSARSVLRIWQRALRETGCQKAAYARLRAAEIKTLARESALGPAPPRPRP